MATVMVKIRASQVVLVVKNLPANAGDKRYGFNSWVGKTPGEGNGNSPGKLYRQRSLVSCSPWGGKGLGMTELTHTYSKN